ncbi:MAG: hypothetical protein K2K84_10035 [Muribaculaceae bacterium]|nr:hypothetical protein [Muribaculaceae bacterium]
MKQILVTLMLILAVVLPARAADNHDDMYMDMAVVTAKKAVRNGNKPTGAVIILNGVWRAEGTAKGDTPAELVAFANSRLTDLHNAKVYTVNEPTTETYNALVKAGVEGIIYANPRDAVIAAGIYPASAYDDSKAVAGGVKPVQLNYPDAAALLKK